MRARILTGRALALLTAAVISLACAQPAEPESREATGGDELATAIFAGGCFWCMEPPFDELDGVVSTTSGYTGGQAEDPSYEEVSAGGTGHFEAVRVQYDAARVDYRTLLDVYWRNIDPLDDGGQFCDRGPSYRSAVFFDGEDQRRLAEQSRDALAASGRFEQPIVTQILPASAFYPAEDYHQDYYKENSVKYKFYRYRCGRDDRLEELWGGNSAAE